MFATLLEKFVGFDDAALDAELREIELQHRRLQACRAAVMSVARTRGVNHVDGHRSMAAYVRATTKESNGIASADVRRARVCDRFVEVGDALAAGFIGISQVDVLAATFANRRVGHLLETAIPALLDHAEHLPFNDFKICVSRWEMLADLDGAYADVAADVEHRSAHVVANGTAVDVAATGGDPLTAATMIGIFERFVEDEFRRDVETRREQFGDDAPQHPLPRNAAQRRFDALETIFTTAHAASDTGEAPSPVVNIVADADTVDEAFTRAGLLLPSGKQIDVDDFDSDQIRALIHDLMVDSAEWADRRCETTSGVAVHPILVVQAALTGHVRRVVIDSAGVVVNMGHKQRLFTGSPRLAATLLARHCSHLGCQVPAMLCDVDHIDEWSADGGATDQHNADNQCGSHDRFKHRERWRTRRAPNGRSYNIRPDGTVVLPVGEREPDLSIDELHRIARRRLADLSAAA